MTTYGIRFQLDVTHDHYGDAGLPVRLEPVKPTADLLRAAEARLVLNGGQIRVFCKQDRLPHLPFAGTDPVELFFAVHPTDTDFYFVTAGLDAERGNVTVLDARQVVPPVPDSMSTPPKTGTLPLDAKMARSPPVAIVRLCVDPRALDTRFEIRLAASSRPWTYHVMGASPDAALEIRDPEGQVTFTALAARDEGRGPILGFRSNQDIASSARPHQRFELVGNGPAGKRGVLFVLPTPRPGPTGDVYVNLD